MSNIRESEHRRGLRKKVEFSLVFSIKGHTGGNVNSQAKTQERANKKI